MILKEPTLQELQQEDEDKLLSKIENMNQLYKNNLKDEFISAASDLYNSQISPSDLKNLGNKRFNVLDTPEESESDFLYCNKKDQLGSHEPTISKSDMCKNMNVDSENLDCSATASTNFSENIILQNLYVPCETLKIIVIGDKAVGKSHFINKLNDESNGTNNYKEEYDGLGVSTKSKHVYIPTLSLEIKKIFYKNRAIEINNEYQSNNYNARQEKMVQLEIWDTNFNILTSNIIKTYYKLCNGFMVITDISNLESIKFAEKQIENIINLATYNANIVLIANIKNGINCDEYHESFEYMKYISERFKLSPSYINIEEYSPSSDPIMENFINNLILKKQGSTSTSTKKIDSNKCNDSIERKKLNQIKESNQINSNGISNGIIMNENFIFNKSTKTHSTALSSKNGNSCYLL